MVPYWHNPDHGLTIYHGDCAKVVPQLDTTFDVCLTDIPYQISQESKGLRVLDYGEWDCGGTPTETILALVRHVTGTAVVFADGRQLSTLLLGLEANGFSVRPWVWHKPNPTVMNGNVLPLSSVELAAWGKRKGAYFGGHCRHNFSEWPIVHGTKREHPTQKPLRLMRELCELSCPVGGVLIDPFLGSGTSLVAAYHAGVCGVGVELNEEYCEVAASRLEREIAQGRLFTAPSVVETPPPTLFEENGN